jgi:hypothetical protein
MRKLSYFILGLAFTAIVHADDYSFTPIKSYTYEGYKDVGSYGISQDGITIPGPGGLVSANKIPLRVGSTIDLELKSGYEITRNGKWVQMFKIAFFREKIDLDSTINKEEIDGEHITFNIFSNFVKDPRYVGYRKTNYVKANTSKSIHEDKGVYFNTSVWNKFTLSVKNDSTIVLYVNGEEALVYRGELFDSAYMAIGTNLTIPFYMKQELSINDSQGNISVVF